MRIIDFRILNYASFEDSEVHTVGRGMNVLAGQNNVGKTALLQALSLQFESKPHRNSSQKPGAELDRKSTIQLGVMLSGQEIKQIIARKDNAVQFHVSDRYAHYAGTYLSLMLAADEVIVRFSSTTEFDNDPISAFLALEFDGGDTSSPKNGSYGSVFNQFTKEFGNVHQSISAGENLSTQIYRKLRNSLYFFRASRIPRSTSAFGSNARLAPDASNLAEALGTLQHNTYAFARYVRDVHRVLPAVKWISIKASGDPSVQEILVWNVDPQTERADLANPLSECGTGVGHVLAILYLIHRSSGDIILIDEPNSFLHPGASRALCEIMRESSNHQFVLSTHAPEVMASAKPDKLFSLKLEEEKTSIREASYENLQDARQILAGIGTKLSDVLGYDKIIWVEGPSEVQAFPLIADSIKRTLPANTIFMSIRSTGDLENKQASAFAEVYRNLSAANTVIPEPLAVLLDGDKAHDTRILSLNKRFPDVVRFLNRRTLENYLLTLPALTAYLNSLPTFKTTPINEAQVDAWLSQNGKLKKYDADCLGVMTEQWIKNVDSTKLLSDLVQDVSDTKEQYKKPTHTVQMVEWMIANDKEEISDLIQILSNLIPQ